MDGKTGWVWWSEGSLVLGGGSVEGGAEMGAIEGMAWLSLSVVVGSGKAGSEGEIEATIRFFVLCGMDDSGDISSDQKVSK